ncbi:MAG: sulfite exporter TauE/SafE family protein [Gammaproteobacteria bacterium]
MISSGLHLLPVFLVGLAGSVHCVGMCGGIVSAFSAAPASRPFPVAVVTAPAARAADSLARVVSYNAGRIASYAVAGAIAGGAARVLADLAQVQMVLFWMANVMLASLGLYLMDAWRGLARLEALGKHLWRHVQPLTGRLMPLDHPFKLFALGGVWGWLPCGMVYSVLATAMLSGSALDGALVMASFGLGTLPMLVAVGLAGAQVRAAFQRPLVRRAAGATVLAFALLALARAAGGQLAWVDVLCVGGMS